MPKAIPIDPENLEQLCNTFMFDVMVAPDKKSLITSGNYGYICAPIGIGDSIEEASIKCENAIKKINIPDMQYRTDIYKSTLKRYQFLESNGWL